MLGKHKFYKLHWAMEGWGKGITSGTFYLKTQWLTLSHSARAKLSGNKIHRGPVAGDLKKAALHSPLGRAQIWLYLQSLSRTCCMCMHAHK